MLPPDLLEKLENSNCDIVHLDLSAYTLTISDLEQLQTALKKNDTVQAIIWPKNLSSAPGCNAIEEYLTKERGKPLGSNYAHEFQSGGLPLCFHQIFETLAAEKETGDFRAVEDSFTEFGLSYKELNAKSNQLAHYLIKKKAEIVANSKAKDIVVAIYLNRSIDFLVAMLAVMKSGCAFLPLDTNPNLAPDLRVQQYCNAAKPAVVISQSRLESRIKYLSNGAPAIILDKIDITCFPVTNPNVRVFPGDLAYIAFSSGSEAEPKGILIEHKGIRNIILASRELFKLSPKDNIAQFASLAFDASLYEIFIALGSRARVTFVPDNVRSDAEELENFYNRKQITVGVFLSSMLLLLNPKNFTTLRVVLSTGEAAYKESIKDWEDCGKERYDGYGPSEVTIGTTIVRCQSEMHVGKPFLGLRAYLLKIVEDDSDPSKRDIIIKASEEGELCIAGEGLARGYISNELTKNAFIKHKDLGDIYVTGDRASFDRHGNIHYAGRIKEEFKLDGKLVSLLEIEETLRNYAAKPESFLKESCVVRHTHIHKQLGITINKIVVHAVPKANKTIDIIDLYHFLALQKPRYMWPAHWVVRVTDLPKILSNGKPNRKDIVKEKDNIQLVRFKPYKSPNEDDTVEKYIYKEMKSCLELPIEFSIYDNFFDLGGTSLLFMFFLARVKARYKRQDYPKLHLSSMYELSENPTVASLARRIKSEKIEFDPIVTLIPNGEKTPVFCIHSVLGNPADTYFNFAKRVLPDRVVYGIRAHALIDPTFTYDTIQEHAQNYAKRIMRLREEKNHAGPIILLGISTGGTFAYEIARILIGFNYKVYVLIVDSISPKTLQTMPGVDFKLLCDEMLERLRVHWGYKSQAASRQGVVTDPEKKRALREETARSVQNKNNRTIIKELFDGFASSLQDKANDQNIDEFKFISSLVNAEMNHIQKPVYLNPGSKIFVFRSQLSTENYVSDTKLGWGDNVTDYSVVSDHFDILQNVEERVFQDILSEADNKYLYTWKLPSIAKDFILRPALVNQIQLELSREKGAPQSVIVLYGKSGVGKSQLTGYILNAATNFTLRVWFNASSYDQLAWECFEFGKKQNIPAMTLDSACEKVKVWLIKNQEYLVVYDNLDFSDARLIDSLPTNGTIIITSNVASPQYRNFEVRNMEELEAEKLAQAYLGCDKGNSDLARILMYHPLSLSLACAFIRENKDKMTIAKYIDKVSQLIKQDDKRSILNIVCHITLNCLDRQESIASEFIRKCSFLNGSYLPAMVLKMLVDSHDNVEREYKLKEILEQLRRFALIRDVDQNGASFHKGLQEIIRSDLEQQRKAKQQPVSLVLDRLTYLLVLNYPFEKATAKHYSFAQELKPHLESVVVFAQAATLTKARLLRMLADVYGTFGIFGKQIVHLYELQWLHETLNQKHSDALRERALTNVALVKSHFSVAAQMKHINLLHKALDILSTLTRSDALHNEILKIHAFIIYLCRENYEPVPTISEHFVTQYLRNNAIDYFGFANTYMCAVLHEKKDKFLKESTQLLQRHDPYHPELINCYQAIAREYEEKEFNWLVASAKEHLELALDIKRKNTAIAYFRFDQLAIYTKLFVLCSKLVKSGPKAIEKIVVNLPEILSLFYADIANLKVSFELLKRQSVQDPVLLDWFSPYNFKRHARVGTDYSSISRYNEELRQLLHMVVSDCLSLLSEPPCSFILLGFGSTGYGLALDKSDFEFGIVLSNSVRPELRCFIDAYFICFIRLFKLLLKTAFEPYGLHIDYNLSPKVSDNHIEGLYGTVDELITKHAKLEREEKNGKMTYTALYALLTHTCLYNFSLDDEDVDQDFRAALTSCLEKPHDGIAFHKVFALQQFGYHHRQFNAIQEKDRRVVIPIKNLYFRPLVFIILDLSLFYNLLQLPSTDENTFNLFKQIVTLQAKNIISERFAAALTLSLNNLLTIRSALHKQIGRYVATELVRHHKVSDKQASEAVARFYEKAEDKIYERISSTELLSLSGQEAEQLMVVLGLLQGFHRKILADLGVSNANATLPPSYDPMLGGLSEPDKPKTLPVEVVEAGTPSADKVSSNLLAIINQSDTPVPSPEVERIKKEDPQWFFSSPKSSAFNQATDPGDFHERYSQTIQSEVPVDDPNIWMLTEEYQDYQWFEWTGVYKFYRECLDKHRRMLDLSGCDLTDGELEVLVDYHLLDDKQIHTIILPQSVGDDSANSLIDLVEKNYHITRLQFNKVNFSDENKELIEYYLGRNKLYTFIAVALQREQTKVLDLRNKNLGDAGVLFLAEQLKKAKCALEVIYLGGNEIGNAAAKKLYSHAIGIKLEWGANNHISAKIIRRSSTKISIDPSPSAVVPSVEILKKMGDQKLAVEYVRSGLTSWHTQNSKLATPINKLAQPYFDVIWNRATKTTFFAKSAIRSTESKPSSDVKVRVVNPSSSQKSTGNSDQIESISYGNYSYYPSWSRSYYYDQRFRSRSPRRELRSDFDSHCNYLPASNKRRSENIIRQAASVTGQNTKLGETERHLLYLATFSASERFEFELFGQCLLFFILSTIQSYKADNLLGHHPDSFMTFVTKQGLDDSRSYVDKFVKRFIRLEKNSNYNNRASFHRVPKNNQPAHERRAAPSGFHRQAKR